MHLETCIKDLSERFARIELVVSPPLVGFRETVQHRAEAETTQQELTTPLRPDRTVVAVASTPDGRVAIRARAVALPGRVCDVLEAMGAELRAATRDMRRADAEGGGEREEGPGAEGGGGEGDTGEGERSRKEVAAGVAVGERIKRMKDEAGEARGG